MTPAMVKRLVERIREKGRRRMAAEYPVAAWATQFRSPEDLRAALERGEGPEMGSPVSYLDKREVTADG